MKEDKPFMPGYKSPKRKFKNKCEVCNNPSIGKRCRLHFDARSVWTPEQRRKHVDVGRSIWYGMTPEQKIEWWKNYREGCRKYLKRLSEKEVSEV